MFCFYSRSGFRINHFKVNVKLALERINQFEHFNFGVGDIVIHFFSLPSGGNLVPLEPDNISIPDYF